MFSAFVLVCSMMANERNCWVVHNDMFYDSYADCDRKVKGLIATGAFAYLSKDGELYDAKDYVCFNWDSKKT